MCLFYLLISNKFLVDLISPANLQARKPSQSCVQVTLTKKGSGACIVQYLIKFKNATRDVIYTEISDNIGEANKSGIPPIVTITGWCWTWSEIQIKYTCISTDGSWNKQCKHVSNRRRRSIWGLLAEEHLGFVGSYSRHLHRMLHNQINK